MNELILIKRPNWIETFGQIKTAGTYTIEIQACDAANVRSAVTRMSERGEVPFKLSVSFDGNTAIITAE